MAKTKNEKPQTGTDIPDPVTGLRLEESTLLQRVWQYRPWVKTEPQTTDCPLIPHRPHQKGEREAVQTPAFDRSEPYYLRGRGDEFNFLAQKLIAPPGAVNLVTGPPGTGKSTLLDTVAKYAQEIGHAVVMLEPDDLTDTATIVQKCRNAVMHAKDAPGNEIRTDSTTAGIDINAVAATFFGHLGVQISASTTHTVQKSDIGRINLIEHLKAVCTYQGKHHRLLILVDEVQNIEKFARANADADNTIRRNLYILNDLINKRNANLPVTTILAGLTPAREIVAEYISRPASNSDLELTPIATPHIRQILEDYLTIDKPCAIRPHNIETQLLDHWAQECQGHVLLANQLGYKLQQRAIQDIQKGAINDTPEGHSVIPLTKSFSNKTRNDYYLRQLPDDMNSPIGFVAHHIVLASIRNQKDDCHPPSHMLPTNLPCPITWDAAQNLTEIALETYPKKHIRKNMPDDETALRWLQHKGIIRRMRPLPHFLRLHAEGPIELEEHCAIPIPTITKHIQKLYQKLPQDRQNLIDSNVEKTMQNFPPDIATMWQWNHATLRKSIPTIPDVQYEPTPPQIPMPQQDTGTICIDGTTYKPITPHHDQWQAIHPTDRADNPPRILTYETLDQIIQQWQEKTNQIFEWPENNSEADAAPEKAPNRSTGTGGIGGI